MRIILCAYHWAGCMALEALRRKATDLFVYTHECPYYIPDVQEACRDWGISCSVEDISKSELPFKPDAIASIFYRNIIASDILQISEGRAFNLHPSLLPKYRGCSSLAWALINGEEFAGYTYHYMNESVDTGNILLQRKMAIYPWDTGGSLYHRVMFEAMNDFQDVLQLVISGELGVPQHGESSYYRRGCPFDAKICDEWTDAFVGRFIRALIFPPLPPARYKGQEVYSIRDYRKLREHSDL